MSFDVAGWENILQPPAPKENVTCEPRSTLKDNVTCKSQSELKEIVTSEFQPTERKQKVRVSIHFGRPLDISHR